MTIAYPLRIFFDCSTAHLSPASRDHLGDQVQRSGSLPESWIRPNTLWLVRLGGGGTGRGCPVRSGGHYASCPPAWR